MLGKEQFMTELKMKEMQLINWFGCSNLNCTRERIHLVAMLAMDEEMKKKRFFVSVIAILLIIVMVGTMVAGYLMM